MNYLITKKLAKCKNFHDQATPRKYLSLMQTEEFYILYFLNSILADTKKKSVKRGRLVSISRRGMRPSVSSPLTNIFFVDKPPSREALPIKMARHKSTASPIEVMMHSHFEKLNGYDTLQCIAETDIHSDLEISISESKSTDYTLSRKECNINNAFRGEMKIISFDKYGDLVELTSPPRLTYVFSHPLKDPAYVQRERLLNYRESRLAINYSNSHLQNVQRESMEEYLERTLFNSKIYSESMPRNYRRRYRDTRYTPTSSYPPWTVDIDNLPTLCRLV